MTETKVTRKDGSSITFVLTGTVEQYQKCITDFQALFDDKIIKPLFDILFNNIQKLSSLGSNKIFLLDSKSDFNELTANGMNNYKMGFDYVIEAIRDKERKVDGIQCKNFIGFGEFYLDNNPSPQSFMATLIHELVHCVDEIIADNLCFFSKLSKEKKDEFNKNVSEIIGIIEEELKKGNLYFKEINTEQARSLDHEKLTYCVQAYVTASFYKMPTVEVLSTLLDGLIKIALGL